MAKKITSKASSNPGFGKIVKEKAKSNVVLIVTILVVIIIAGIVKSQM